MMTAMGWAFVKMALVAVLTALLAGCLLYVFSQYQIGLMRGFSELFADVPGLVLPGPLKT